MPHRHGHWISSPPPRLGSREETRREDGWEQLRSLFPTGFQPRTKLAGTHRTLGLISSTAAAAYPPISTNPARRHHTARQSCAWASWPCKPQLALPDHLDPTVADVMSSPPLPAAISSATLAATASKIPDTSSLSFNVRCPLVLSLPRRHRARDTIPPLSAPCPVTSAGDPPTPTATTATPTTTTTTTLNGGGGLSRCEGGPDLPVSHDDNYDAGAAAARGRFRYAAPRHRAQLLLSRAGPDRAGAAAVQQENGQIAGARYLSPSVDASGSR